MEDITKFYSLVPPGFMRCDAHSTNNNMGDTNIDRMPIGMAYVPWQNWQNIYEKDKGLIRGTIFEQLDKPFKGAKR